VRGSDSSIHLKEVKEVKASHHIVSINYSQQLVKLAITESSYKTLLQ
jgi:hypothetical protein